MTPKLPLAALALIGALVSAEAAAEPQILALLRTDGAVPLACEAGRCQVDLSAFCMEPGRAGPPHESPYTVARGRLTLVATAADGSVSRRDVTGEVSLESRRGYAAVRVGLAAEPGAARLALEVGEGTVLLPVPLARHRRPHEPAEVARALGPNRVVGTALIDDGGAKADAARLLDRVINLLPERGAVVAERRGEALRRALAEAPAASVARGGDHARASFERCEAKVAADPRLGFRHCLERQHDHALWSLNHAYWKRVGPES